MGGRGVHVSRYPNLGCDMAPFPGRELVDVADRLTAAVRNRDRVPVRDLSRTEDLEAAYSVLPVDNQARSAAGAEAYGRLIAAIAPTMRAQLRVDHPDFGVKLKAWTTPEYAREGGGAIAEVPLALLVQLQLKPEIAFVLGTDPTRSHWTTTPSAKR